MLPQMVSILDEPIGDAAAINTVLICRAAREAGVRVLLSGMGADELFGGYRKHYACLLAANYRKLPAPLREKVIANVVRRAPVAIGDRGIKATRWAQRFVNFAVAARGGGVPAQLHALRRATSSPRCCRPSCSATSTRCSPSTPPSTTRPASTTP